MYSVGNRCSLPLTLTRTLTSTSIQEESDIHILLGHIVMKWKGARGAQVSYCLQGCYICLQTCERAGLWGGG